MDQLQLVLEKYKFAQEALQQLPDTHQEAMIPLTESLYIPATMKPNAYLIDIGTNYYVKQSRQEALEYYKNKIVFVQEQMKGLELILRDQAYQQLEQRQVQAQLEHEANLKQKQVK